MLEPMFQKYIENISQLEADLRSDAVAPLPPDNLTWRGATLSSTPEDMLRQPCWPVPDCAGGSPLLDFDSVRHGAHAKKPLYAS